MIYTWAACTEKGTRKQNEDALAFCPKGEEAVCALICDGLGGHADGEIAAAVARDAAKEAYVSLQEGTLSQRALRCVESAQEAVCHEAQRLGSSMRTTIALLCLEKDRAVCAHVGDTRMYLVRKNAARQLTLDHSVAQALVAAGECTSDQIRTHEDRHQLTRALGMENCRIAVSEEISIFPGDRFLICSDGWWELVYEVEMEKDAPSVEKWLQNMRLSMTENGKSPADNYSALAIRIEEGSGK